MAKRNPIVRLSAAESTKWKGDKAFRARLSRDLRAGAQKLGDTILVDHRAAYITTFEKRARAANPKRRRVAAKCNCGPVANKSKPKRKRAANPKKVHAVVTLTRKEFATWSKPAARLRLLAQARKVAKRHGGAAVVHAPGGAKLATVG